ncbi:MAG TPA: DUF4239 domain-containing protein [Spirochaetota bacterium]|nr:DUF4239 domain-containing protein [Spirochaetota bacterium]HPJ37007.1 DUF4239 domain-containing protein [Spirochaetota bacterium]HPQ53935.1 DUF4239 domain-containing protein [Spirochaetota bacterium]
MGTIILHMPLWLSIILVAGTAAGFVTILLVLVRKIFRYENLKHNNEVAGFMIAVLGAIYSVMLAFMILTVYDEFKEGRNTTSNETASIIELYRFSEGFTVPFGEKIRKSLIAYADSVVVDEWPCMEHGVESAKTMIAMNTIWKIYLQYSPANTRESVIYTQSIALLDDLRSARQNRILSSKTLIPGIMWFVLISGAMITVAFSFFFGSPNMNAQIGMTALLAVTISLLLLLLVQLDNPFFGPVSIDNELFRGILIEMRG